MIAKLFRRIRELTRGIRANSDIRDIMLQNAYRTRQMEHPNKLCRYGGFGFSQTDEDGITSEIIKRLDIQKGVFCEFGVGNGMENNTLILLALGWKGFWVGGEKLAFAIPEESRLQFDRQWITKENIFDIYKKYFQGDKNPDVVSLDLDGNDLYLTDELLSKGVKPKLFIVEYNAKILPNIEFSIDYDAQHQWQHDDYMGASLLSFVKLFAEFSYQLICCNAATGANAFFVKKESMKLFPETPKDIDDIYTPPFYFLPERFGHKKSIKTVLKILQ